MGVWGPNNFDNDPAGDFLDSVRFGLHENINDSLASNPVDKFNLDDDFDGKLMPSIDILNTLCEYYRVSPLLDEANVLS